MTPVRDATTGPGGLCRGVVAAALRWPLPMSRSSSVRPCQLRLPDLSGRRSTMRRSKQPWRVATGWFGTRSAGSPARHGRPRPQATRLSSTDKLVQHIGGERQAHQPWPSEARVFDPFFTTARESGGTSLCLSSVCAIAAGAGGTAELVESGQAACFSIDLSKGSMCKPDDAFGRVSQLTKLEPGQIFDQPDMRHAKGRKRLWIGCRHPVFRKCSPVSRLRQLKPDSI